MLLFVSYSGVLGGAERVLLDAVTRIERPLTVACPDGPLAQALRAAGIAHAPVAERPLQLSLTHAAGIAGLARDIRRLKPEFVVAWGARAVLAATLESRPWLAVHHDLLPRAGTGGREGGHAQRERGGGDLEGDRRGNREGGDDPPPRGRPPAVRTERAPP